MKKLLIALTALAAACGCSSRRGVIEGSHFALGAYLPWDGQLYGVELMQFVNGAYVGFGTNDTVKYEREYAATNSYLWGMVETREWSRTKAEAMP